MRAHTERLCATSSYRGVKVDGIFLDPDITGAHLRRVKAHDGVQREADWSQAHKKESDAAYFEFLLITEFKIQLDGWMHYNIPPWFSFPWKTTVKSKHVFVPHVLMFSHRSRSRRKRKFVVRKWEGGQCYVMWRWKEFSQSSCACFLFSFPCKQMHMVHKVCIDCAGTGLIRNELSCHTYPISRLTDFLSLTSW